MFPSYSTWLGTVPSHTTTAKDMLQSVALKAYKHVYMFQIFFTRSQVTSVYQISHLRHCRPGSSTYCLLQKHCIILT